MIDGKSVGQNSAEEWDDLQKVLKNYNMFKEVFRSHAKEKKEVRIKNEERTVSFVLYIDVKRMANLVSEIRMKVNSMINGDY